MPGAALTKFDLDMSGAIPVPYAELTMTPYKLRNLGLDFETTAGSIGLRGEAAWSFPFKSFKTELVMALKSCEPVLTSSVSMLPDW